MKNFFKPSKEKDKKPENHEKGQPVAKPTNQAEGYQEQYGFFENPYNPYDYYIPGYSAPTTPAGGQSVKPQPVNNASTTYLKANQPYIYQPKIPEKKLTIILIEDTIEMMEQESILIDFYARCKTDILTVIHYGENVRVTTIETLKFFKNNDDYEAESFRCSKDATNNACLSDALSEVVKIVSENYNKVKEKNFIKTKISSIDIIGIGTCKDNCSKISREQGTKCFCEMLKNTNISSKYFCLSEKYFFEAAEFGFRSIGSISRSY